MGVLKAVCPRANWHANADTKLIRSDLQWRCVVQQALDVLSMFTRRCEAQVLQLEGTQQRRCKLAVW